MPKSVIQDVGALYIGREELNGTLVVAKDRMPPIVAYIVISDQRSGTFLIPVSQTGQVENLVQTRATGKSRESASFLLNFNL